jgi:hypothetical protein
MVPFNEHILSGQGHNFLAQRYGRLVTDSFWPRYFSSDAERPRPFFEFVGEGFPWGSQSYGFVEF